MFWSRWQENVAVLWWGWSLHPEVLVLSVLLYPRNCYRWLELMIATPVPGDVLLRLATLVWKNISILLFRHLYMNWCKMKRLFEWPLVFFVAKATYAAIANTYSYLTPDLWKETAFTKSPYQEFTDYLAKNHTRQPGQRQEQKVY